MQHSFYEDPFFIKISKLQVPVLWHFISVLLKKFGMQKNLFILFVFNKQTVFVQEFIFIQTTNYVTLMTFIYNQLNLFTKHLEVPHFNIFNKKVSYKIAENIMLPQTQFHWSL